jgi:hypothetical protein
MADLSWYEVTAWADCFASGDLNSLANGSRKMSTLSDPQFNNTGASTFIQFEAYSGGSITVTAGSALIVQAVSRMSDGTNWPSDLVNNNETPLLNYPYAAIQFTAATLNPHRQQSDIVPIPPGYYRFCVVNRLGVALASSGNMVRFRTLTQRIA